MSDDLHLQRLHAVTFEGIDFNDTTFNTERRGYVADAAGLNKNFLELRTALMLAFSNHELSGN